MDLPITVTQRELWSLSPEVRAQVREATIARRIAAQGSKEPTVDIAAFVRAEDSNDKDNKEMPVAPTFAIPNCQHRVPPDGAFAVLATRLFQMGLGHPSEPMCINPGKERNGFLSFLCKLGVMMFHSFHCRTISIISINPGRLRKN